MSDYPITEYGAVDGAKVTDAFQRAVDACAAESGGIVRVPPDNYETGSVELRDDVALSLAPGAVIHASPDEADYDCPSAYIGPDGERLVFVAHGCENVTVAGDGVVDGRGTDVMEMDEPIRGHSGQSAAFPLVSDAEPDPRQGEAFLDPTRGTEEWPVAKPPFRPGPTMLFDGCADVAVRDVTLQDMPAWTLAVRDCDRVVVTGVDVHNHMRIPNCDGLSVEGSRDVRISDCSIRCCDDAITLLSRDASSVCENVAGLELIDIAVEWSDDLPAYYTHGVACVGVEDVAIEGFDGGPAHPDAGDAAILVQNCSTITVRNSRARPETETFLAATDTADERLFAANDLADAERAMAGETDFTIVGNAGPR